MSNSILLWMNRSTSESSPRRADAIFGRAFDLPAEEHEEHLAAACGDDTELLAEVQTLLWAHKSAPMDFLDPVLDSGERDFRAPNHEKEGDIIGTYTLRQQIGEGGFGTVWMAEQTGAISRMVALKIVKAGMDTREVLARFEAERRALAMMDHPNIAKVFEAGATPAGRPYFVMELVKGVPITRFCDERKLDLRRRLELFMDVCSAVHHAHQNGIIHRDLKPSNILVTLASDEPVVKIIDFGIAKATHGKLTDKTFFTRFEQFLGTPAYMSPEQAAMSSIDVDTRSDIYSLGILLYELLAGSPPFDQRALLSAGFDEMRRIIAEDEPPKLSTRATETQAIVATAGGLETPFPVTATALKGELDWIVMKAIEKDRSRRYETTIAFAQDIGRYLKDEPVQAAAPGAAYLFGKFARRNKAVIGMASAMTALLLAGIATTSWQAVRATREMDRAVAAEALAEKRLQESSEARAQSDKDRELAIAALEEAEASRREAETVSRRLHDDMLKEGSFAELSARMNPLEITLINWATNDPDAALRWYHEKVANGELAGPGDDQHLRVVQQLLTGLILSAPDKALTLYADTPLGLKDGSYADYNPTVLLASKYGAIMANTGDDSGLVRLVEATEDGLRQQVVSSAAYEFSKVGKLDEGLRFVDQHRPEKWRMPPSEAYFDRDDYVRALAFGAHGMDKKERLDWRIANSSSVPDSVIEAAAQLAAVEIDTNFDVKPVGVELSPEKTELSLAISSTYEDAFMAVSGGQLAELTDSTGKNLLQYPGGRGLVFIDDGREKGWILREGIREISGDGKTHSCTAFGTLLPEEGAQFVTAKGTFNVNLSTQRAIVRTLVGRMEKGCVFSSNDIQFQIARVEPSAMERVIRGEGFADFVAANPTQFKLKWRRASGSIVPLANPMIAGTYRAWRFISQEDGKVHELRSGGPSAVTNIDGVLVECAVELFSRELLTDGSIEVEYWTDFRAVQVPFEVRIELDAREPRLGNE